MSDKTKIVVKVPATSANIGPGFDCMGVALNLYNTFTFIKSDEFRFINVEAKFATTDNLIIVSAMKTYELYKITPIPFSIDVDNNVPIARGLGSSATCIVAGIVAASHFGNLKLTKQNILEIATLIEGHPDNVAPAIYGSLVSSVVCNKEIVYTKYDVDKSLIFTVVIPDFELETKKAREVLPKNISLKDAVFNMSRAINVPTAFTKGDTLLLYNLLDDKIHEPFRLPLIKHSEEFVKVAQEDKIPFCISGSGPTLLFITKESIKNRILNIQKDWLILELSVDEKGVEVF